MPTQILAAQQNHKTKFVQNKKGAKPVELEQVAKSEGNTTKYLGYASVFALGFLASQHPKAENFKYSPQINVGIAM